MKIIDFPYDIVLGKLDSIEYFISCSLLDEEAERLEQSAYEGNHIRIDEDDEIRDIYDHVYLSIISKEKTILLKDSSPVADALSWNDDYDPSLPITEQQIDEYLDELDIRIYYPKKYQLSEKSKPTRAIQSKSEQVIIERKIAKDYICKIENINKTVFIDQGSTLFYIPKSFSGLFIVKNSVNHIEKTAFKNCKKITEVIIESGIKTIPEWAFDGCKAMQKISLPSTVINIEYNAFTNCSSLKEVILSEGLKKIDSTAFRFCSKLESITIPASVSVISMQINSYNNGLKHITFEGEETIIDNSHGGDWRQITIHAKHGSFAERFARNNNIKLILKE